MLTLSAEEVRALAIALDNYLPELSYETARVKLERDRHDLVELERVLVSLRARIAAASAETSPVTRGVPPPAFGHG